MSNTDVLEQHANERQTAAPPMSAALEAELGSLAPVALSLRRDVAESPRKAAS